MCFGLFDETPHNCVADNTNSLAFEGATKIIGGRDAIKEFLTCIILPVSDNWSFEVERAEAPLAKVIIPLSKVPTDMGEQEMDAEFEVRVAKAANHLVVNYSLVEHRACIDQLRHGRQSYLPRPKPTAHGLKKQKVVAASGEESIPRKVKGAKSGGELRRKLEIKPLKKSYC
jgi:hypothetical protein